MSENQKDEITDNTEKSKNKSKVLTYTLTTGAVFVASVTVVPKITKKLTNFIYKHL